jgi:hypothetical protein
VVLVEGLTLGERLNRVIQVGQLLLFQMGLPPLPVGLLTLQVEEHRDLGAICKCLASFNLLLVVVVAAVAPPQTAGLGAPVPITEQAVAAAERATQRAALSAATAALAEQV